MMNDITNFEARITQYLNEVEAHISTLSEEERTEILESVKSHIDNELKIRSGGQPTKEDIEAVLMDMDPPEFYSTGASLLDSEEPSERKLSKYSIIGVIILPFGFLIALLFVPLTASTSPTQPTLWQQIFSYILLPVSIVAPFASTALGFLGISEIRNSESKRYGLPLAVFVTLFYPIIILTLILIMVGWTFLGEIEGWTIIPLVWLVIVLVIDYIIIRFSWRVATRK